MAAQDLVRQHLLTSVGKISMRDCQITYWMSVTLLDYSTKASFLLSCIMASNTLIAYPIVSRYGLQQKPSVTLSVGSSMISLLIALVMLAGLVS